jgi:hypothetical protein
MAQEEAKFIQISESQNGLHALDEAGDVWSYTSDQHGKNGYWSRLPSERGAPKPPAPPF